ncbi:hypothetical protein HGA91_05865 [candidate division WWE3 bacterium]|nr:hypothetical protein [candidate division WWE3 bacterium]
MNNTHNAISGKKLIGMKIVTLENGKQIETVEELIYDPNLYKLTALVLKQGGWFSDAMLVMFEDIQSIGDDAVMIQHENVLKKGTDFNTDLHQVMKNDNKLTSNKVITERGTHLGAVSDVFIDISTGYVVELEVTQGVMGDIQSGKKRVQVEDIVKVGEDAILVKEHVEQSFEEQARHQGIYGTVSTALEKTKQITTQGSQAAEAGQQKATDAVNTIGNEIGEVRDQAMQESKEIKEKIDETRRKDVIGKYLTINILSPDDQVLGSRGDMITNALLDDAEKSGMLQQVLSNVSDQPVKHAPNNQTNTV